MVMFWAILRKAGLRDLRSVRVRFWFLLMEQGGRRIGWIGHQCTIQAKVLTGSWSTPVFIPPRASSTDGAIMIAAKFPFATLNTYQQLSAK